MTDRELLQQALDALDYAMPAYADAIRARLAQPDRPTTVHDALLRDGAAKRARLAEPEPEPVAWMFVHNRGGGQKGYTFHTLEEYPLAYRDTCLETIPLYTHPAPQSAP